MHICCKLGNYICVGLSEDSTLLFWSIYPFTDATKLIIYILFVLMQDCFYYSWHFTFRICLSFFYTNIELCGDFSWN